MTANGILQIVLFLGIVCALVKPLGIYMARVFERERTFLDPVLEPIERLIYRLSGVRADEEQHWTTYTVAMLLFSLFGLLVLYALQRLQHLLPLNPLPQCRSASEGLLNPTHSAARRCHLAAS